MVDFSRTPLVIVEIDVDYCSLTYGTGACTAVLGDTGPAKCFNMRKGCQSVNNFSKTTKTLRFSYNQAGLPFGETIYPVLQSVSTLAGELNLSGIDEGSTALGSREYVTITLQDFPDNDTQLDKYQSERVSGAALASGIGYNPEARGRFLSRLHARWPYYTGRALRMLEGYVGDDYADMTTRHYVIYEWSGPDASGTVEIEARDALDLVDSGTATCPVTSTGLLEADIDEDATTFTIWPEGTGDDEYPASGWLIIGSEVMAFTRSGDDFKVTRDGAFNTEVSSHSEDDTVQLCVYFNKERPSDVINTLLMDYSPISDTTTTFDVAAANALDDRWMAGVKLERLVSESTGVNELIGEICQLGIMTWHDTVENVIEYQLNRPLDMGETYYSLTDEANIIEGTANVSDLPDSRLSRLKFFHGLDSATDSTTDSGSYSKVAYPINLDAEGENQYNKIVEQTIYSPWFGLDGNTSAAFAIATRIAARYAIMPQEFSATLDISDFDGAKLGQLVEISSYVMCDEDGSSLPTAMRVKKYEVTEPGNRVSITAETWTLTDRYAFVAPDGTPEYNDATDDERLQYMYITDNDGNNPDGTTGFRIF